MGLAPGQISDKPDATSIVLIPAVIQAT